MDNMKTNYEKLSDNELISAIRGGDNGALDFLLNKYKNLVRGKAKTLFLIGGDKDDLIQEGMIGLYMAIRDYEEGTASFATFADICTTRRIYNAIESQNRLKHKALNESISLSQSAEEKSETGEPGGHEEADDTSNPERMLIQREEDKTLFDKLRNELSELEMQVLELYLSDNSYAGIAKQLGKSEKSIDNCIQRIRKKIKKIL